MSPLYIFYCKKLPPRHSNKFSRRVDSKDLEQNGVSVSGEEKVDDNSSKFDLLSQYWSKSKIPTVRKF